jgi:hypothetical protein
MSDLFSPSGGSDIRLSPISFIFDIGVITNEDKSVVFRFANIILYLINVYASICILEI